MLYSQKFLSQNHQRKNKEREEDTEKRGVSSCIINMITIQKKESLWSFLIMISGSILLLLSSPEMIVGEASFLYHLIIIIVIIIMRGEEGAIEIVFSSSR